MKQFFTKYYVRLTLIVICTLVYCLHSEVFELLYPDMETDYDEFLEYYADKNILNEFIFSVLFLCVFLNSIKWVKAVSIFGFVMTFGSLVDKLILGINDYIMTDVILLIFATRLAWLVRKKEPPNGQPK